MKKINPIQYPRKIGALFKTTFQQWWARDPFSSSAVIAYNAIFSLPGILVVVISIAGYFFGSAAVSGRLHNEVADAMGSGTADLVESMIMIAAKSSDSVWASVFGIATIITGAIGVFVQFQKSLNAIWEVKGSTTKSGIWSFVETRLLSFGLIISIAFLLLMSLVVSSLLSALSEWMLHYWSGSLLIVVRILNSTFSFAITTLLFVTMFKFLPDAKIQWKSVWTGAFVTSLLFTLGKSALGLYFGKANPGLGYGAAGSVILILLWTSYSSMIVFFGAEFTKVYSDNFYGKTPSSENGVKV